MQIIVIAVGTAGDVFPLLGLSQTFSRRGHKVSFCTSPAFAGVVERCGLRFLPLGTVEQYRATVNDPELWKPRTSLKVLWAGVATTMRPLFDLMCAESDNDTIIAGHPWAFGARFFQEKFGVPMITLQVSPSTFLSAKRPPIHKQFTIPMALPYPVRAGLLWAFERGILDRVCGPEINRLRKELGLKPVKRVMGRWMHSPQGVLGLFPDWFAPLQSDWPSGVELTGFPLFDDAGVHSVDPELEGFLENEGDPPIVFTPGSTLVNESAYRRAATDALEALGCRGIFLGGQGAPLPKGKSTVMARAYVPLSKLLPRARALVHHGGIGTVSQAFAAGIPQLITPFAHDQFDNAARVERLGCGHQTGMGGGALNFFAPLRRLLEDDAIQHKCVEIRSRVESDESSCQRALQALENIALGASQRSRPDLSWQRQPRLTSA
jgi:rhamnosyltransferase subunit B